MTHLNVVFLKKSFMNKKSLNATPLPQNTWFYEYANDPHLHSLTQIRDPLVDHRTLFVFESVFGSL